MELNLFPSDALIVDRLPKPSPAEASGWSEATLNREKWVDGPWRDEPDKIEWIDPATNLNCMIIRNRHGVLCGYVGVPEAHPWYGVSYNGCVNRHAPKSFEQKLTEAKEWVETSKKAFKLDPSPLNDSALRCAELSLKPLIDDEFSEDSFLRTMERWDCTDYGRDDRCQTPESVIDIHGGLTFSGLCREGHVICHSPKDGRTARPYWFGFDTGHCMDFSPGMEASSRELELRYGKNPYADPNATYDPITGSKSEHGSVEVYRSIGYVKAQVESLAQQLAAIGAEGA